MAKDKDNLQADQYWKNRTLCSDENCIGVIGPDGRCKECGKKFEGDFSKVNVPAEDAEPPDDIEPDGTELGETVAASAKPSEPQPDHVPVDNDWENRRLCSDESCIGVIGPDGRCKECGKPFEA
jgi:hypothetical protein